MPKRFSTALLALAVLPHYDWDWVKKDNGTPHVIRDEILIDAPMEVVWKLVSNPSDYQKWNPSLKAKVKGAVAPGTPIELDIMLYKGIWTHSSEKIDIVDPAVSAISWRRSIGCKKKTNRWQVLEQDGHYVHYYTALQTPGSLGWIVDHMLAKRIKRAFYAFGVALKAKAEKASARP
jgi:hypothetical protein